MPPGQHRDHRHHQHQTTSTSITTHTSTTSTSIITSTNTTTSTKHCAQVHEPPIVYRYVDWSIAVLLQTTAFNLILKATGKPVAG